MDEVTLIHFLSVFTQRMNLISEKLACPHQSLRLVDSLAAGRKTMTATLLWMSSSRGVIGRFHIHKDQEEERCSMLCRYY